jgi:purine-nucleoside phosphorylase
VSELVQQISEAVGIVRERCSLEPRIAIILGTGLSALANRIRQEVALPYCEVPHFPQPTVQGHGGELVFGHLGEVPVVAMSGRFHYYEGYTLRQVTFPVHVAKALGAGALVVSNAAGGLNPQFKAGDLMVITDHINFMGDNPLIGPHDDALGPRFPDMCEPYSRELVELAVQVALEKQVRLRQGVYLACAGPSLETPAEYRMMRGFGADAVGMSTVPEVIVAVAVGMRVLGFSAITDECLPDALEPVDIDKIIRVANEAEPTLTSIVETCVQRMDSR